MRNQFGRKAWLASAAILAAASVSGCVILVDDDYDFDGKSYRGFAFDQTLTLDQDGDYTAIAGDMTISGRLGGDLELVAGDLDITNIDVGGDVSLAAGDVNFTGSVRGETSIAGGDVDFAAYTGDELNIAGGDVTVIGDADGDANLAGGEVTASGRFGGDLNVAGGQVRLSGSVSGRLIAEAGDDYRRNRGRDYGFMTLDAHLAEGGEVCAIRLEIGPNARFDANVVAWVQEEPVFDAAADASRLEWRARDGRDCDDLIED